MVGLAVGKPPYADLKSNPYRYLTPDKFTPDEILAIISCLQKPDYPSFAACIRTQIPDT